MGWEAVADDYEGIKSPAQLPEAVLIYALAAGSGRRTGNYRCRQTTFSVLRITTLEAIAEARRSVALAEYQTKGC